ncbi:hypothetical protein ACHAWT_000894 [Skeletonema menzelii]
MEYTQVTVGAAVKVYLSRAIRNDLFYKLNITKRQLIEAFDYYNRFYAKCFHRGATVATACVIHDYNNGIHEFDKIVNRAGKPTRYLNQAFNINGTNSELPESVVTSMNHVYPPTYVRCNHGEHDPPVGFSRFAAFASKQYATNAANHMRANFYIYQEYTIISFLKSKGYTNPKRQCSPIIHELKRRINNYEDTIVVDDVDVDTDEIADDDLTNFLALPETKAFVHYHRFFFEKRNVGNEIIDSNWVDNNLKYIPLYFVHLLRHQELIQKLHPELFVKKFNVLPMPGMKRCSMEIDRTCLFWILLKAGLNRGQSYNGLLFPNSVKDVTRNVSTMDEWWSMIFYIDIGNTATRHHLTSICVRTDGVVASFLKHQVLTLEEDGGDDDYTTTSEEEAPPDAHHDAVPPPADDPPPSQPQNNSISSTRVEEIIGGLDPGVQSLFYLVFATPPNDSNQQMDDEMLFKVEGLPGHIEYTLGNYRQDSKIVHLEDHVNRLQIDLQLKPIYRSLSKKHLKTSSLKSFYQALRLRTTLRYWHKLWRFGFVKSRIRRSFFVSGQKMGALQRKMNHIAKAVKEVDAAAELYVGFGDGKWGSSPAPTRKVKENFGRSFKACQEVDEFRTSSICINCGHQLYNLFHFHNRKRYYIRGIKYCNSDLCRKKGQCYYHRDKTGAINILKKYLIQRGDLDESMIPYLLQRSAGTLARGAWQHIWRSNKGSRNCEELKVPGNNLSKKQQDKLKRERRAAQKKRRRVRRQRERD